MKIAYHCGNIESERYRDGMEYQRLLGISIRTRSLPSILIRALVLQNDFVPAIDLCTFSIRLSSALRVTYINLSQYLTPARKLWFDVSRLRQQP